MGEEGLIPGGGREGQRTESKPEMHVKTLGGSWGMWYCWAWWDGDDSDGDGDEDGDVDSGYEGDVDSRMTRQRS